MRGRAGRPRGRRSPPEGRRRAELRPGKPGSRRGSRRPVSGAQAEPVPMVTASLAAALAWCWGDCWVWRRSGAEQLEVRSGTSP